MAGFEDRAGDALVMRTWLGVMITAHALVRRARDRWMRAVEEDAEACWLRQLGWGEDGGLSAARIAVYALLMRCGLELLNTEACSLTQMVIALRAGSQHHHPPPCDFKHHRRCVLCTNPQPIP